MNKQSKIKQYCLVLSMFVFQFSFAGSNQCSDLYSSNFQERMATEKNQIEAKKVVDRILSMILGSRPSYFNIGNYVISDSKLIVQNISDKKDFAFLTDGIDKINKHLEQYGNSIKEIQENAEKTKTRRFSFSRDLSKNKKIRKAFIELFKMNPNLDDVKKDLNEAIVDLESKKQSLSEDMTILANEVARLEMIIDEINKTIPYNRKEEVGNELIPTIVNTILDIKRMQAIISASEIGMSKHIKTLTSLYSEIDQQRTVSLSLVYREHPELKAIAERIEKELFKSDKPGDNVERPENQEILNYKGVDKSSIEAEEFCIKKDLCSGEIVFVSIKKRDIEPGIVQGILPNGQYLLDFGRKKEAFDRRHIARTGFSLKDKALSEKDIISIFCILRQEKKDQFIKYKKVQFNDKITHGKISVLDKVLVTYEDNPSTFDSFVYGVLPSGNFILNKEGYFKEWTADRVFKTQ